MASEVTTVFLGDVAELIRGVSYRPADLLDDVSGGIALLRATNIRDGYLDLSDALYVPSRLVSDSQKLQRFDTVIAMSSGSRKAVGRLAQLRTDWTGCVGAFCGVIRPNPKKASAEYIGYVAQSSAFRDQIDTHANGTAIMNLSRENLLSYRFLLPSLPEQRAIAHILGTLDDKIELNRQMSATLEAMARALFESWFVRFDPVRAKAAGRDTGLPADIAALFPDSFEESEIGEVPKGWRVGRIADIAAQVTEVVRSEDIASDDAYIGLEHMPRGTLLLAEWSHADGLESHKHRFREGDYLFGKLRPYFKKVGIAFVSGVCSTDIVVCRPLQQEHAGLLLGWISHDRFIDSLSSAATGTRMPRTSWAEMTAFRLAIPPQAISARLSELFETIRRRLGSVVAQNRNLSAARDTLLPKLISGELRVPDAERVLASAGVS